MSDEPTVRTYVGEVTRDGFRAVVTVEIQAGVFVPDHDELSETVTTSAMRLVRQAEKAKGEHELPF